MFIIICLLCCQLDLDMTVNYGTVVRIELREPDKKKKPQKDEILGNMYLHTDDIPIGDTSMKAHNYQEFKKTHYIFRFTPTFTSLPTTPPPPTHTHTRARERAHALTQKNTRIDTLVQY